MISLFLKRIGIGGMNEAKQNFLEYIQRVVNGGIPKEEVISLAMVRAVGEYYGLSLPEMEEVAHNLS